MICGSCNNPVDEGIGYSFCPHCGKPLGAAVPPSTPLPQSASDHRQWVHPTPSPQPYYPNSQSSLPAPLQPAFVFRPGETLLRLMNVTYIGDSRRQMGSEDIDIPFEGVLIVTDQRLTFAVLVGLMSKRWSVHKNIELANVKGTEIRSGFRKNYLGVYMTSNRVTYTEAWMEFFETDLNTIKRGMPLDLTFAQQVINGALARKGSGMR